jgi:hypothetical protein
MSNVPSATARQNLSWVICTVVGGLRLPVGASVTDGEGLGINRLRIGNGRVIVRSKCCMG